MFCLLAFLHVFKELINRHVWFLWDDVGGMNKEIWVVNVDSIANMTKNEQNWALEQFPSLIEKDSV